MIPRYQSNLRSFAYPENWKLTDSDQEHLPREISVESPEGTLWVMHAFAPGTDPQLLIDETIASFQQNYEDFEWAEAATKLSIPPTRCIQAHFFCLDFLVTAQIMVFTHTPLTYLVIHQAESRQFEKTASVMEAITTSLITSVPQSEDDPDEGQ